MLDRIDPAVIRRSTAARITADTTVWAIQPEIVAGLSSLEVSARRPDGGTDVLLALTEPSPDWPTPYLLKTPRRLARGSECSSLRDRRRRRPVCCASGSVVLEALI